MDIRDRLRNIGINIKSARLRRGLSQDERTALKRAYKYLWYSGLNLTDGMKEVRANIEMNKYVENLTHEITHAMQFAEDKEIRLNRKKAPEGQFYNFYQQNTANILINTLVPQTLVEIAKQNKIEMNSLDDYEKFLESPSEGISDETIKNIYSKHCSFQEYINTGFDMAMEDLMQKMQVENDVLAQNLIEGAGGVDKFKAKIKTMVVHTLRMEEEAYKAGSTARKAVRNFTGKDYNDTIPQLIGLVADALCCS